jgi:hypothetical protein
MKHKHSSHRTGTDTFGLYTSTVGLLARGKLMKLTRMIGLFRHSIALNPSSCNWRHFFVGIVYSPFPQLTQLIDFTKINELAQVLHYWLYLAEKHLLRFSER